MAKILSYVEKDTWIHRLSGVTKLVFFLLWCLTSMLTYDTRVLAVMVVLSLVIFKISKTQWKQVGAVFKMIMLFLVLNVIAIFLFSPDQGTHIYGTRTVLFHLAGPYDVTKEQLFYFIGNSEFWKHKKEQEFTEHMLDKLLSGDNDKTTRFRRYKNLPLQSHHQISHLHLRNNPYPEGHPRSCSECPRMTCLRVGYPYIFCVVSLCLGS